MNGLVPNINVNWVPGITLEEMEKQCILAAFRFYRSNKTQTAGALGIAIRTLDNKLEKYEADGRIEQERYESDKIRNADILSRLRGIPQNTNQNVGMGNAETATQSASNGNETKTRVHVQPAVEVTPQHSMPLPKRGEVQEVLSKQAGQGGNRGRR